MILRYLFLVFVLLCGGCSTPDYLKKPQDFHLQVKGLVLTMENADRSKLVAEIIAVSETHIMVLSLKTPQEGVVTLPKGFIRKAVVLVSGTSNSVGGINAWAGLLIPTTLFHGYYSIYSFPTNLIINTAVGLSAATDRYALKYPEELDWEDLAKFARFPQGVPESVDQSMIR